MTTRPRPHLRAAALVAGDLAVLAGALVLAYLLRFRWEVGALRHHPPAPFSEYVEALAIVGLLVPLLLHLYGAYRGSGLRAGPEEAAAIVKAVTLGLALVLAAAFFYRREGFQYSRLTMTYWWFLSVAGLVGLRALHRRAVRARLRRGLDRRRAVLLGRPGAGLLARLRDEPAFGLDLAGYVDGAGDCPPPPGLRRLGALADLPGVLGPARIETAIVVDHDLSYRSLLEAIAACEDRGIAVHLVAPPHDLLIAAGDLNLVAGTPLIRLDETRPDGLSMLAKRVLDVTVSAALLAALAPLLIALAVVVRLDSPGPVLFVQTRAGRGGQPFRMFKFRTMVADAERRLEDLVDLEALAEPVFKLARDPRVTRAGRVLRRFSLDEIPQLWNVLRGDMSLVGPRPEELRVVRRYDVWQRRRLKVKPGLTGLQQVTSRAAPSLDERVRLDVHYIRRRSFLLDLLILLRTPIVVLTGKGAS